MMPLPSKASSKGFTLLEILLVLFLIGMAVSYVLFNAFSVSQSDRLKEQARRFQVIVDMASDYAVLNQTELGIRFEAAKNEYFFMALDDENQWQVLDDPLYSGHTLPQSFSFELELDSLPWEETERLFDRELFDETLSVSEDSVDIGNEEDKSLPPPQVLIMSSGEITPFSVMLAYEPDFSEEFPVYFFLNNKDVPPLELKGPYDAPEQEPE
ncbi:type II secretion system protein GspH [Alteromonas sediminis]|uniref:Type II secretion system protein H n=1 Tax=Alteromonas sediminis TaxID=2259342 RepID=A0A3N5XZT7_9ALTE|nr:type II secretion system minor pseudopilin GspH [Alteromonas sediminis]RPJ66692.1 type II secretion system protein GspH [Alteromonas sediminis]